VDPLVNKKPVVRREVVVVNEHSSVEVIEIVSPEQRRHSLN
jgi:hypothetical protein